MLADYLSGRESWGKSARLKNNHEINFIQNLLKKEPYKSTTRKVFFNSTILGICPQTMDSKVGRYFFCLPYIYNID